MDQGRIGSRVTALREARGWSQRELARRANTSQVFISQIESGRRPNPSFIIVCKLATAFDVPVDTFCPDQPLSASASVLAATT